MTYRESPPRPVAVRWIRSGMVQGSGIFGLFMFAIGAICASVRSSRPCGAAR